ncbi:MAG: protein-L-isoaspartate O-methyltransferase [Candidatus Paceibacterota bacterium]
MEYSEEKGSSRKYFVKDFGCKSVVAGPIPSFFVMTSFVNNLINSGHLRTERIIDAFRAVRRRDFVPREFKEESELNEPLPTAYGQTISQPLTVAFMLELLSPGESEKVLDVGSGSGWQSALLACIVGEKGKVIAIERIPELSDFGRGNAKKYGFKNLEFVVGDGTLGYKEEAPFDKIIVAASAAGKVPSELKKQLKVGGRLVIPVDRSIWLIEKISENGFKETEYPGFVFVPLIPNSSQ